MKINKLFLGLAVVFAGCLAACNTDVEGEYYSPKTENVAFEVEKTSVLLPKTETSGIVPIRVIRSNTAGAYTAHYTAVASKEGIFSDDCNGTVNFADGEGFATINVKADNLEKEVPYKYTMTLSPADTLTVDTVSTHKFKQIVITVQREGDWILIGTGKFYDTWLWGGDKPGECEVYYNEKNPNQYRIVQPFEAALFFNFGEEYDDYDACISDNMDGNQTNLTFTLLKPGDKLADVTITRNDLVYYEGVNTGYFHSTYGEDIMMYHPADFSRYSKESDWVHNCVVEWQENGLPGRVQFAPYFFLDGVGGGWNQTQVDGVEYFDFPGFEMKDYTLEMEYTGIFTDPEGVVSAVANLTLGADATNTVAVIVPADADAGAVADAIVAGDLEGMPVENGYAAVPIPEDMNGKLQMVVVVIDGGVAKVVDSVFFEYYGGGAEPWTSLGIGYWIDDMVVPAYTEAGQPYAYEVEIQESTETPGLYRVVNAYAPVAARFQVSGGNKNIEINAEDPNYVYILPQEIGMDLGYGAISIASPAGRYVSAYGFDVVKEQLPNSFGKLENGVFNFPIFEAEVSSGTIQYQMFEIEDGSAYYAATNGAFKVVLPGASADAKKRAKRMANATDFALRLNGHRFKDNNSLQKDYIRRLKQAPRSFDVRVE